MSTRTIDIEYRGSKGQVTWKDGVISADIKGRPFVTAELRQWLRQGHQVRIPKSGRIDDYALEKHRASESLEDFELLMGLLWSELDVFVHW